jgi:hypothetical protein
MAKAAVLPVPVWAMASTSSPLKMGGMDLNWISVGFLNPSLEMLVLIPSVIGYSSNFIHSIFGAKVLLFQTKFKSISLMLPEMLPGRYVEYLITFVEIS